MQLDFESCKYSAGDARLLLAVVATPWAQAQSYTVLHSFDNTDGFGPVAGLVQATNGNLYGTTASGGANNVGTIFKITPAGALTTLQSFDDTTTDGAFPFVGLVQAINGNLYGTTVGGGSSFYGTVFKTTPGGTLTTLYSFCAQPSCTDGAEPYAGLVQATNGGFYGTTAGGPFSGYGTVFKITPDGTLTTLHNFDNSDGEQSEGGLVQATDGNLYGTTYYGGANSGGTVSELPPVAHLLCFIAFASNQIVRTARTPMGVWFRRPMGPLRNDLIRRGQPGRHDFPDHPQWHAKRAVQLFVQVGCTDGLQPQAGLVQATDGNFYGTTIAGGAHGYGTIFQITTGGTLTTLHSFNLNLTDGAYPQAALVQATDGNFYGTTINGGTNNSCNGSECGTVFRLSMGLGPFVETNPTSGKVRTAVKILGTKLTGATSVTFNGKAAVFKVVSGSEITTTVPTGATTGKVKVKTPSGTLTSNVNFRVP